MRIVSFLPSATETIFMLNAGAMLVGVTHECNYPRGALKKKRVIRASFDPAKMTSAQIDAKIAELLSSGKDIYQVDDPVLKRARPQLLVAQGLCEVCSPFTKEISRAVSVLAKKPQVLILDPHDLAGILRNVQQVADAICKMKKGKSVVSSLEKRIEKVRSLRPKSRPRVLCIEWLDPIFSAGHWVPETVEIAGGINGISAPGEPSRRMKFEEVEGFDPD
ncbi:MAG TPA: cobalamin-binding protein, partial [Nitrososphaera sp.]|nr:cobalamin-binding protein [Nitrososphaera sp.]